MPTKPKPKELFPEKTITRPPKEEPTTTSSAKPEPTVNGTPTTSDIRTLAEAAAYLRVSEEGLRADAERSHVPAVKMAGEWRFSKSVILDWFRHSTNRPATTTGELLARLKPFWANQTDQETPEETEMFLEKIYAAR